MDPFPRLPVDAYRLAFADMRDVLPSDAYSPPPPSNLLTGVDEAVVCIVAAAPTYSISTCRDDAAAAAAGGGGGGLVCGGGAGAWLAWTGAAGRAIGAAGNGDVGGSDWSCLSRCWEGAS